MKLHVLHILLVCSTLVFALPAARAQDSIRSINKYGFLNREGQGPKAVKGIPAKKEPSEDETWENIWANMKTSFSIPWEDFLAKDTTSSSGKIPDVLTGHPTDGLSGSLSVTYPLSNLAAQDGSGNGSQGVPLSSAVVAASLSYVPLGYWFVSISAMRYWFPDQQRAWNPDFTYSFGYNDWHPYTLSLVYSNFGGNRFNSANAVDGVVTHFWRGTFSLGWKFPTAKLIEYLAVVHPSGGIGHGVNVNFTPEYLDGSTLRNAKTSVSFSTKYTIYENIYCDFTVNWYPIRSQQQPWDPDFTYGFGFFDWHPFTISIQYNNYAGGRFPWNPTSLQSRGILDGTISASWSFSF
jgi:hypothetical protein